MHGKTRLPVLGAEHAQAAGASSDWPPEEIGTGSMGSVVEAGAGVCACEGKPHNVEAGAGAGALTHAPGAWAQGDSRELDATIAALVRDVSKGKRKKSGAQVDLSRALGIYPDDMGTGTGMDKGRSRPASPLSAEEAFPKYSGEQLGAMDAAALDNHMRHLLSRLNRM
jgi:hypothetical protein